MSKSKTPARDFHNELKRIRKIRPTDEEIKEINDLIGVDDEDTGEEIVDDKKIAISDDTLTEGEALH